MFSPDGARLALVNYGLTKLKDQNWVEVFDTARRERLAGIASVDRFDAVRFHPDGRSLWTLSRDATVRLWGPDGKQVGDAWVFPAGARLALPRDGRALLAATADLGI